MDGFGLGGIEGLLYMHVETSEKEKAKSKLSVASVSTVGGSMAVETSMAKFS